MGPALLPIRREEKRNRFGAKNAMFGGVLVRKMAGLGRRGGAVRGSFWGEKGEFWGLEDGAPFGVEALEFGAEKRALLGSFWGQKGEVWGLPGTEG